MRQVWIGCSRVLHAQELIRRYIDPFYKVPAAFLDPEKHAGEVPELVRSFGAGVIDLGGFEVLGREDAGEAAFDYAFYEKYRPFREHPPNLRATNFGDLKSVFFIVCSSEPSRRSDGFIVITDVMSVTFDWEV
jgi:hypothetical protein